FGDDYPTRDGSCIRDFIHVCDIAHAHTLAVQFLMEGKTNKRCEVFNLGTGNGVTVLEAIRAFEKVTGEKLNYVIGPRRPGDVIAIYANNDYARSQLNWETKYSLEDMLSTAWKWEQRLKVDEKFFQSRSVDLNYATNDKRQTTNEKRQKTISAGLSFPVSRLSFFSFLCTTKKTK